MLDLIVRNGSVVDGTGGPARRADVGISDGRVVAVGELDETAAQTFDADGRIVAPGFVDLHTHYDAQLLWDPTASPSPLHGVTTVLGGNCGFSLAPTSPKDSGYLTRMMAKVEGMPRQALEAGLDWEWRSFGDYLDRLEGQISVNAGFMVGHSTLRRGVMGDAAVEEKASAEQVASMVERLHKALAEGGMGFSTSTVNTHHDGELRPVPSRLAERSEFEALAAAVAEHPGTSIEMILQGCLTQFSTDEEELMTSLSRAGRPAAQLECARAVIDVCGTDYAPTARLRDGCSGGGNRCCAQHHPQYAGSDLLRLRVYSWRDCLIGARCSPSHPRSDGCLRIQPPGDASRRARPRMELAFSGPGSRIGPR